MSKPRPIIDSHLDLAWSAVFFDHDLSKSVQEIRDAEKGMSGETARNRNVLSYPELRKSGVAVCVGTLLARCGPKQPLRTLRTTGPARTDVDYIIPEHAYAAAHAQLAYYRLMEQQGRIKMIRTATELDAHWAAYAKDPVKTPMGMILSMEGADPIVTPDQAHEWFGNGLRVAGLTHYGIGRHGYGTAVEGPLGAMGIELLRVMADLGMILDVTHLCDESMAQAFDYFEGPLLASHHNCRALVPGDRQLTDDQIKRIIARNGVIGGALDAWMLYPAGWIRGQTHYSVTTLQTFADHIDHVCQIAGNTRHSALGTDLDGGFGNEQTPADLRIYSDLQNLAGILAGRGYSEADIDAVFHNNWLNFFRKNLPK